MLNHLVSASTSSANSWPLSDVFTHEVAPAITNFILTVLDKPVAVHVVRVIWAEEGVLDGSKTPL
jgi:hypothetical protein